MKDNKMEREESLNFFKLRVNSFVDSEPKSNAKDCSSGALEEKSDFIFNRGKQAAPKHIVTRFNYLIQYAVGK